MPTYRIIIQLTESEYLSLARIAHEELRAPRWQAVHILRTQLITSTVFNPAPESSTEISPDKKG